MEEEIKLSLNKYTVNEIGSLLITVLKDIDKMIILINWQDRGNLVDKKEAIQKTYNLINNYYNTMIQDTSRDTFTMSFDFSSIIVIYSIFFTFDINRKKATGETQTIYSEIVDIFDIYE